MNYYRRLYLKGLQEIQQKNVASPSSNMNRAEYLKASGRR
mgnify:CR=1 FL=1